MSVENPSIPANRTIFILRMQFRQNATWQGNIEWLEGKKSRPFRSILEMTQLMQEAWEESRGIEPGTEFTSWDKINEGS